MELSVQLRSERMRTMNSFTDISEKSAAACALLLLFTAALPIGAQPGVGNPYAPRGVVPFGSYSAGAQGTVDNVYGSLSYSIPFATLPAGRAGFSMGVPLTYNSNVFDLLQGTNTLAASPSGGWQYAYKYGLNLVLGQDYPVICGTGDARGFQMSAIFPDGSSHLLHLYTATDDGGNGYYAQVPGRTTTTTCDPDFYNPAKNPNGDFHYFTDDGTYVKVVVSAGTGTMCATPGPTDCWLTHPWTMYFKDGTQVAGVGPEALSISDPNGNTIQIRNAGGYGAPTTMLQDDFGRSIQIQHSGSSSNPVDTITQTGPNGGTLTWTVNWELLSTPSVGLSGGRYNPAAQTVVSSVVLPANSLGYAGQYSFGYDTANWGQLNSATTPSGATAAYTYANVLIANTPLNPIATKVVTWCDESDLATPNLSVSTCATPKTDSWSYSIGQTSSTVTGPDGGASTYSFYSTATNAGFSLGAGLVYKIVEPDGSVIDQLWQWDFPYETTSGTNNSPQSPYIAWQFRSVASGGAVSSSSPASGKFLSTIDRNGNTLQQMEFDWRTRGTLNFNTSPYADLTSSQSVTGPARTSAAVMQNGTTTLNNPFTDDTSGYWNPSAPKLLAMVACRSTAGTGNGTVAEFSHDSKGNITQQRDWDSTRLSSQPTCGSSPVLNSGNAVGHSQTYDAFGNVTDAYDAYSNDAHTTYDANSLYPITGYDAYGSSLQRATSYSFDFNTGLLVSETDYNGLTRAYTYDNLGRTTQVKESGGSNLLRETTTTIDDANRRVATVTDLSSPGDQQSGSVVDYDQLGRVRLTRQLEVTPTSGNLSDDTIGIKVQTRFAWGTSGTSYQLVSNPYRATTSAGESASTMGWTLTKAINNGSGRSTTATSYTGASQPVPFGSNGASTGSAVTSYSVSASPLGESSTAVDQASVSRTTVADGLGRTGQVTENGPGSVTTYTYDVQDNLLGVAPSAATTTCAAGTGLPNRAFGYDSLGRLSWACNPESGVTGYDYDFNSNLKDRADARGKQSTRTYDALSRLTGISYNDSTPAVSYSYTGPSQTQDFQASVSSSASAYTYSGYDALGRPGASQQATTVGAYTYTGSFTGIAWTPQGDMKSITYPSGRTITTSFDSADRPVTVAGSLAGGATTPYTSSGVQYTAHSGISQLITGEGVTRSIGYNSRLQVASLVAVQGSSTLLSLGHTYGVTSSQNNGSPSGETITRPSFSASQSYAYDTVNRLISASEAGGWSQNYVFDGVGNRAVNSGYIPATTFTPQTSGSTVPYNAQNHWVGAVYDPAGNMTSVSTQTMTYDAEGRLLTLVDGTTVTDSFTYDGDGRRVTKTSNSVLTTYVYDPNGELAMEVGGASPSVAGTMYVTRDRLGSTRLTTNASGAVGCHDYLPFGEEIPGAVSGWGRNTVSCYGQAPETDVKFTGQLFDAETGLAYFNARYLRASMGSYISADEPLNDQGADDPQSWKLDSYVRNNPLAYSDPTGMACSEEDSSGCGFVNWLYFRLSNFQYFHNAAKTWETAQQTAAVVKNYLSAPRDRNCMAASTVKWSGAFSAIGGTVGLAGAAGGPVVVATVAGGIAEGGAIGGVVGGAIGIYSCSRTGGPTSGDGGTGTNLKSIHDRIERLDPNLSQEEIVEKIKQMFPKTWHFDEFETAEGILLRGARGEGILVTEEGEVFAGKVPSGTILESPFRLR
jgi:RHS repeat-associated protein